MSQVRKRTYHRMLTMWISILATASLCIGVFGIGTTEDPCEISARVADDFTSKENPSNESLMDLLPGLAGCDARQVGEAGLLAHECQLDDTPIGCQIFTNFVLRECVSYRSGNWVKSCSVMVEGLFTGNSFKEELFPRVFTSIFEEIIDDADDPLFKIFDEVCEERKKENELKKAIALCSTLGGWVNAINATDQAISTPENLRSYIGSVDELYANMARWHLRKKWHPDTTTLTDKYEQECAQSKPADMYCEVLKEKLDAYQQECAREPSKCETATESNRATNTFLGATVLLPMRLYF